MICPAPPDDDFNVGIVVFIVVAALLFGLAASRNADRKPEKAETSESIP